MESFIITGAIILAVTFILLALLRPVVVWLNGNSDVIKNQKRIIELLEKKSKD